MRRAVEIADPRPLRHAVRPLKARGSNNKGVVALGARLWRAIAAQWEHFYALPAPTLAANRQTKPRRFWAPSSGTFVGVSSCLGAVSLSPPFNALSHRTEAVCNVGESCRGFGIVSVGTSR